MAFEIGERVTGHFTGPGTVQGPLVKDEDGVAMQLVAFDHPLMKTRTYPISRLQTLESEPETKPKSKSPRFKSHLLERENPAQEIRDYQPSHPEYSVIMLSWNKVKKVRVIAPAHLQDDAKRLLTDLGIDFPSEWRGTTKGKRGGKTVQRSLSAQIQWLDGSKPINDRNLVLKILSEGKFVGWRVTELV